MIDHRRLLVKVARLYYEQELTQAKIAEHLRISRQKVQRMLGEAREAGIVNITISPVTGVFSDLERALEQRFRLAEAIMVETTAHDHQPTVAREVGTAAAQYLLRSLRPNDKVVLSWGNSLLAMVNALGSFPRIDALNLCIIQGLGGLGDPSSEIHATQLVGRAASALNARAVLLPAPAVAGCRAARDAFMNDPYVAQVLEKARSANLAFVGIGSSSAESILVPEFWNIMTPDTLADLKSRGAVGSINLRYFDDQGRPVSSALDDTTIGLKLEDLQKIYRVVAVAGGSAKLQAIQAALEGRLIDVLVTDHLTGQRLLKAQTQPSWHDQSASGSRGLHA